MKLCSVACFGAALIAEDANMDPDEDAEDAAGALKTLDDLNAELLDGVEALVPATGAGDAIIISSL